MQGSCPRPAHMLSVRPAITTGCPRGAESRVSERDSPPPPPSPHSYPHSLPPPPPPLPSCLGPDPILGPGGRDEEEQAGDLACCRHSPGKVPSCCREGCGVIRGLLAPAPGPAPAAACAAPHAAPSLSAPGHPTPTFPLGMAVLPSPRNSCALPPPRLLPSVSLFAVHMLL